MKQLRGKRRQRIGIVISDKMDKSIVVRVERTMKHPVYKRIIKKSSRIMAHDGKNQARIGNRVRVEETRPLSKNKRWRLIEILK